jgi:hypothetical protein
LVEQIREKNRIRFVTAAFRGKFFRQPNSVELAHWIGVFQADVDLQRFLAQIAQASARSQPLAGMNVASQQSTALTALDAAPAKKDNPSKSQHKLGARASFFYGLMQPTARLATVQGTN